MPEIFARTFYVGWGDLDSNAHMKSTAYLEKAVDVRMMFFESAGFSVRELEERRLGPVVQRDEIEYFRELRLLETVRITLAIAGLSADGSRFSLRSEFYRDDGKLAAKLTSTGGWLDLAARRLTRPPEDMAGALRALLQTEDFAVMPSSIK